MLEELRELQTRGYVRLHRHPVLPLWIANYTPKTQFERAFTDHPILLTCRGLVLDDESQIVARGFPKFFNYEEHAPEELPLGGENIEVTEKLDGSLLIVFRYAGQIVCATRGSFLSEQAVAGAILFRKLYHEDWIEDGKSYLFEYVAPTNRIVVRYDHEDLIHLACLDSETGKDRERDSRFRMVNTVTVQGGMFGERLYNKLKGRNLANQEGYILRVRSQEGVDFRCKIKFETYIRLHRIVTGVSTKMIWEYLRDNRSLEELLENTPDEFNAFVRATVESLTSQYAAMESEAVLVVEAVSGLPTRRGQAQYILEKHPNISRVVFKMLDGTEYRTWIWNRLEPEYQQPFADRAEG